MNIQIIGDNFNVSSNTKQLVEEKVGSRLDRLLTHFAPEIHSALIRIQKDKFDKFLVNFDMNLPDKKHIYAEVRHQSLESALIDLQQQAEKQIQKYKKS